MLKNIVFGAYVAQHFLLSAAAKTLSLSGVARMSDKEARATFSASAGPTMAAIRIARVADASRSTRFRAASVEMQRMRLSVFGHGRDDLRRSQAPDPRLSVGNRDLRERREGPQRAPTEPRSGVPIQDGVRLAHKLREVIEAEQSKAKFVGACAVDGAYFGGHIKPENEVAERVDRRIAEEQTGKRQVVVVMPQRRVARYPS